MRFNVFTSESLDYTIGFYIETEASTRHGWTHFMAPETRNRRKYSAAYGPNPKDAPGYIEGSCRKIATMDEQDLSKFHEECYQATAAITEFDEKDFFWARVVGRQSFQKKIFEWDFSVEMDWRPVCCGDSDDGTPLGWSQVGSPTRSGSLSPDYMYSVGSPTSNSPGARFQVSSFGSPTGSSLSSPIGSPPYGRPNTQWASVYSSISGRLAGTSLSGSSDANGTTESFSTLSPSPGASTSPQSTGGQSRYGCNS
jgi:hypothetical protein